MEDRTDTVSQSGNLPEKAGQSDMQLGNVGSGAEVTGVEADDVQSEEQRKRDKDPLRFCVLIVKRPLVVFFVCLFMHISFLLATGALLQFGFDIFPISFTSLPLEIRDNVDLLRRYAWSGRDDDAVVPIISRSGGAASTNVSERTETGDTITLYYEQIGGNVFTKAKLLKIKETEELFLNNSIYQSTHCKLDDTGNCTASFSVLRYFDGTYEALDPVFLDPNFNNIPAVLEKALTHTATKSVFPLLLGKNYNINSSLNIATSEITRSFIYIGLPLPGYANSSDKATEQNRVIQKFLSDEFFRDVERLYANGIDGMDFFYYSSSFFEVFLNRQVIVDMLLAIGSMAFIFIVVWVQTGSLWITGWAILSIITGFTCANMVYRIIVDFRYFGVFHVLAIFIILGIGADDVFIFFDTWKASGHHQYLSLAHRLSDCYRRASAAMFFTSLTTACAFIISGTSPLLGVSSFGVFSGILVLVNYLSVITFLPAVVMVYHVYWEKKICCCCGTKTPTVARPNQVAALGDGPQELPQASDKRQNPVVRFFRGPYFRFISHKVWRWIILLVMLGIIATFGYFATQIKVNEEEIKFLPDSSNFGKVIDRSSNAFAPSDVDDKMVVNVIWGLQPQDLKSCHFSDSECDGKTVWDDAFDLNSAQAQLALQALCGEVRNNSVALKIRTDSNGQLELGCFLEELVAFLKAEENATNPLTSLPKYPAGTTFDLPYNQTNIGVLMQYNPHMYNTTALGSGFSRYFEIALHYWIYSSVLQPSAATASVYKIWNGRLGESTTNLTQTKSIGGRDIKYGNRLRYAAAIYANLSLSGSSLGYIEGLPVRNKWEEVISNQVKTMPSSVQGGFQNTRTWHWLAVQELLNNQALLGIVIGVAIAYPILIVATMNIITGTLAVLTICFITASVVGTVPVVGWKLGVLESLNFVLVVGLAVDYVVHLAEGYSRSMKRDRLGRVKDMLEEVGISVLSGAITTLGASIFLLFAFITFFQQFAIFIFSTIGFSIVYALGFFSTVLALIGPQEDFGSLKPLWRWVTNKCSGKTGKANISEKPPINSLSNDVVENDIL
ncbi:protein dispatched homolog 1 [Lingula anatina]|uniref:Protein dispatched homolog 1 n=1 Tax=Lingula anatina TaxID=7574 RepID=A0A1S3ID80_LINAN|nr:protein dispatched homolog 1 [Lingula anatina]|eukprot:XP_013396220.1 protein dispatched homolog 1 [Lingula anatina]